MILTTKKHIRLNPLVLLVAALILIISSVFFIRHTTSAEAVTGWKAGNIIDDSVMANKATMSVSQIQSFLNSKVTSCDTNGQQLSEFGGPDLNSDGKVQRWEWGKANYNQTTFPCLKNYKENNLSSAQIIYNAAQKYSINPQVLLVLLQKEQGLVQDTWPLNVQYKTATGYGCPDTAPCDKEYFGLTNQIDWASTMFRAIMDNSPNWYTPYVLGKNYIQYNPSSSCGGSTVNIENRATQALYNYTPYQPNQGALNAGWGTASCGAYGNRNFYLYFTDWFGSTRAVVKGGINTRYIALGGANGILGSPIASEVCKSDGCYQTFSKGVILWSPEYKAWESMGKIRERYRQIGLESGVLGYPVTGEVRTSNNGIYQKFENGHIYLKSGVGAWDVRGAIRSHYLSNGSHTGPLGFPRAPEVSTDDGGRYQEFENGRIYWKSGVGAWDVRGGIGKRYMTNGGHTGELGYPLRNEQSAQNGGRYQEFENGRIYWKSGVDAWDVRGGIGKRYMTARETKGPLGFPRAPEVSTDDGGRYQEFENGRIYWKSGVGAWDVRGGIGKYYIQLKAHSGPLGYPKGAEFIQNSNERYQEFENGRIYWKSGVGVWEKLSN